MTDGQFTEIKSGVNGGETLKVTPQNACIKNRPGSDSRIAAGPIGFLWSFPGDVRKVICERRSRRQAGRCSSRTAGRQTQAYWTRGCASKDS